MMSSVLRVRLIVLGLFLMVAVSIATAPARAASVTLNFENITHNSPEDVGFQLSVTITDLGGGQVEFFFENDGPIASIITDVYFDLKS